MPSCVKGLPVGYSTRAPLSRQREASGISAVMQMSPAAILLHDPVIGGIGPFRHGDMAQDADWPRACRPPLLTMVTARPCRTATFSTSAFTGTGIAVNEDLRHAICPPVQDTV